MNIKTLFGENVRNIRKTKGLTQEELGDKARLNYRYIGAIERGEVNIALENIIRIANALNISPAQLFVLNIKGTAKGEIESLHSEIISIISNADFRKLKLAIKILKDVLNMENKCL